MVEWNGMVQPTWNTWTGMEWSQTMEWNEMDGMEWRNGMEWTGK